MTVRQFTIDALITRMEQLCDIENDSHFSSAEKFSIMNSAIAETWDLICDSGLAEKYVKKANFSSVAGTLEYTFASVCTDGDFYRMHRLYVVENTDQLRPLQKVNPSEIQSFRPPQSAVSLRLYYIPYSPVLTTGQYFDGINGWEEHTLMTACCAVKMKKEDDYNLFYRRKKELEARIKSMSNVDLGEPIRVSRKRRNRNDRYGALYNPINAYGVRGDKIELYYYSGYMPY
jgi:hypothetical protein